ncbi:MAG: HYR domain-containing protein [Bacteroidota bacterium]
MTLVDNTAPNVTVPAQDTIVECDGAGNTADLTAWLDAYANVVFADACSEPLDYDSLLLETNGGCGMTTVLTYAFFATDACGNVSAQSIATFTIEDTTSPMIVAGMDLTVECDGVGNTGERDTWLANNGGATATDVCSSPLVWTWDLITEVDSCGNTGSQTYLFTVTDDCGNTATTTANFIIEDTTAPLITGGENYSGECDQSNANNDDELLSWLNNRGGATAGDLCGMIIWSNNYDVNNFMDGCNDSRNIDVTFTATDDCGNSSEITLNFSTGDNTPPEFTNCPRPPIVVDAPEGWCNAFVNFSLPTATDNCGSPIVEQTDTTGLTSGALFPVGLTILEFTTTDSCGNSSICELKIIVNDFHTPPAISCVEDVIVNNDPTMCGAIVNDIAPFDIEDNCSDNLAVIYSVTNDNGEIIQGGLSDASGVKFPVGTSTVTYEVFDQPILLITELMNDGGQVGVEISNIGPANFDISCLNVAREGVEDTLVNISNGTILPVGEVLTVFLDPVDPLAGVGYTIGLLDYIIDAVSVNGYDSDNYDFDGDIIGSTIFRAKFPDTDSSEDWSVGNSCAGLSFGLFNPELPQFESNGTVSSLQSESPNVATCSFDVTVIDSEAPFCADIMMIDYPSVDTPITFTNGACATSTITITDVFNVSDVNIINLEGNYPEMSEVTITLTSPEGTVAILFDGLCANTADWDIDLDDQADASQASITCSPLGNGNEFQPLQSLHIFNGEAAFGDWQLDVYAIGNSNGELSSWTLQLSELAPYTQTDTIMVNDTLLCGAQFDWQHPFIGDNCESGSIAVQYIFLEGASTTPPILVEVGAQANEFFEVGTTQILYTLTDAFGNTSQCGFEVTVIDAENPDLTEVIAESGLCEDIIVQLEPGACSSSLTGYGLGFPVNGGFAPFGSMDNCGVDSVSYDPPANFEFPIGTTEVTITIYDAAGNEASCTFNVTVLEFDISNNQLTCNAQLNLSLGPDCMAEITADMILEGGPYGCYDDYIVTINGPSGEIGNSTDGTNIVGLEHVGMTLEVVVCTPDPNPNCCSSMITIELKQLPNIECAPDTIISCNMATNPKFTGMPELLTCEQDFTLTYFDDYEDFGPCGEPRARITRTWTLVDESNNSVTCEQTIDIEQFDTEDVEFPEDHTIETALDCALVANDPSQIHPDSTGYPTINGLDIPLSTNGLCMVSWNWDDQLLFSCQGSYEILRKWFVRDMCEDVEIGVNPIEHYQIIKVIDNEGPKIHECPNDITISTDPWSCTGTYELADIISTIDDNCGGVEQVYVSVNGGTVVNNLDGTYTLTNMTKGDHLVRVRVRDYCFNYSTCEFTINVIDGTPPVVVCTQFISVGLTTDGKAKMFVESVDNGSFDNCTDVRREVFRMDDNCNLTENLEPGEFVEFCCEDIDASPIMVALRIWDDANMDGVIGNEGDNSSLCMVEVTVEEKVAPNLICPSDITLECNADIEDLSVTGSPEIFGACLIHTAEYQDFVDPINDCGAAIINRRWSIADRPEVFCTQVITLETGEPFDGNIQWPPDWEGACLDDIPQNEPIFLDGVCDQVAYSADTDTFNFVEGVCYKLVKEWRVIDWCQYEPNDPNSAGIWYHTQIIKISDNTAPEIQNCEDVTIDLMSENCIEDVMITNIALDSVCGINAPLRWAYQLDLDADGIWDIEQDYNDLSNDVLIGSEAIVIIEDATPGDYKILWKAFDGCGNVGSCEQNIVIRDGKAPTPYCFSELVTVLMQDVNTISIGAADFDIASFDNCTAAEDLVISFAENDIVPTLEFSCVDIENGISQVFDLEMWVWDEAGNKDFCSVSIEIQDNLDLCQDTLSNLAIISGVIATEQSQGVNDVEVTLESFAPEYPHQNQTNEEGEYFFLYNPTGYDYRAKAVRNTDYREGVNTLDLVMIQRHILGLELFDSPYKVIAGDITDDQRLTATDLLSLRKLILGVTTEFENDSWRFVDSEYEFSDIYSPFPYDEVVNIDDLMLNISGADMVAVKIGDVNGSASTQLKNNLNGSILRSNLKKKLVLKKISIDGETYIEFKASEDGLLYGFQFTGFLNGIQVEGIKDGAIHMSPEMIVNTSDKFRVSWSEAKGVQVVENDVLFSLKIDDSRANGLLKLAEDDILVSEIYFNSLTQQSLEFEWRNTEFSNQLFRLDQNEPNPFKGFTEIGFYLPKAGDITLTIYSVDGKELYQATEFFKSGQNNIPLHTRKLGLKGVLIYEIKGNGMKETKRMISLE